MIKAGMKFMDSDFRVHTITKVTDAYGGGFYHLYRDNNEKLVVGFMLIVAYNRLLKCGAIVES